MILTFKTPFPNNKNNNYGIILVNSFNLSSAINDGINLSILLNDVLNFDHVFIIVDNQASLNKISERLITYTNITSVYCENKNMLFTSIADIINKLIDGNIIICISSHGYANGDVNYIIYNNEHIYDYELNFTILNKMSHNINCIVLVDACQSGTEFNLNYKTTDLINYSTENKCQFTHNIICISAVSDYQYDEDDISDMGYDGGLTSAFIDYYKENDITNCTIGGFYLYYSNRISTQNVQSTLSFNNIDFIKS